MRTALPRDLIPHREDNPYAELERITAAAGGDQRSAIAYLKARRLYQLARWCGATGEPLKPEGKGMLHKAPYILPMFEDWRRDGEALGKTGLFGMAGRRYFAARFAVTPYAIPEDRR